MRNMTELSPTHKALLRCDKGYHDYILTEKDGDSSFGMKYSRIYEMCQDPMYQSIEKDGEENRQRKWRQGKFTPEMKTLLENKPGKRTQTGLGKLDQFFTKPEVAKKCYDDLNKWLEDDEQYFYVEPSAGDGSFFKLLPLDRRLGLDIHPQCKGVRCQDFLKFNFLRYEFYDDKWKVVCMGNPPFGKNSCMAVKFFNHCAKFANVIAFIVPRTFNKVSLQNKLDLNFHLVKSAPLADDSFLFGGESYKVPCCFQIWVKKSVLRQPEVLSLDNDMFSFVKKTDGPDLAVRRVGGTTGKCTKDIEPCKDHSFYFLQVKSKYIPEQIMIYINRLYSEKRFLKVASQSSGVRSMSRGEFIEVLKNNPYV